MNLSRFLFFLMVFLGLNGYLYIRGWQALPDRRMIHMVYTTAFLFASLSVFVGIFASERLPAGLSLVFEQIGGYWIILFIYLIAAALAADLLRVADHFFHFFPGWVSQHYTQVKAGYLAGVFLLIGIISLVGFIRFSHPHIVEMKLSAGHNSGPSTEITIVTASDLHLGNVIRKRRLIKWVNKINGEKPDIIFLAGDIFDHSYRAVESQHMGAELGRLQAPFGVYAIPGNHDYYTGVDKSMAYLRHSGIKVLRDSALTIDNRFVLVGRDDRTNRNRKTLASLLTGTNSNLPRIVLDHQPLSLSESVENHIDLHLSGHTHNGQIFPFNRIVAKIYDLSYGYRKTGSTHFYVSSGIGLWGAPLRLGTQSEIVKIHLMTGRN